MNILDPRSKEFEEINKEYFKAINVQKTTITQLMILNVINVKECKIYPV